MVIQGDVISLNKTEAREIANKECKKRLGMTLAEFRRRQREGKLPHTVAVLDVQMMLKCAK